MLTSAVTYVKNCFYKNSILQAADNTYLKDEKERNKNFTYFQSVKYGCFAAIANYIPAVITSIFIERVFNAAMDNAPATASFDMRMVVARTVVEEIIMRGGLQNSIAIGQQDLRKCTRNRNREIKDVERECILSLIGKLKTYKKEIEDREVEWLFSPSARVLIVGLLFAAYHYGNGYVSTVESISQIAIIFAWPVESIIFETAGLTASVTSHVVYNVMDYILKI